jgi:hypothetical protein
MDYLPKSRTISIRKTRSFVFVGDNPWFSGSRKLPPPGQENTVLIFIYCNLKTGVNQSKFLQVLPVSLAQIFLLHFNLRFPTLRSFEKVAPILSVCLAALYPLTLLEIYYSVNALHTNQFLPWDEFLQRFKVSKSFVLSFGILESTVVNNSNAELFSVIVSHWLPQESILTYAIIVPESDWRFLKYLHMNAMVQKNCLKKVDVK